MRCTEGTLACRFAASCNHACPKLDRDAILKCGYHRYFLFLDENFDNLGRPIFRRLTGEDKIQRGDDYFVNPTLGNSENIEGWRPVEPSLLIGEYYIPKVMCPMRRRIVYA